MPKKVFTKFIDYLSTLIIVVAGFFFLSNLNYFSIPDPDIFQYIDEGKEYIRFKLPQDIQAPPLFPVLLTLGSIILKFFSYPEILSAHAINVVAATTTLVLVYRLLRSYSNGIGFLITLLLVTNPTFLFYSLNTNTEVLYTTITALSLCLYKANHAKLAYAVAGLSFLVRYEGIVLIVALAMIDVFRHVSKTTLVSCFIIALTPVVWWITTTSIHDLRSVTGNVYVQQILQFNNKIPNHGLVQQIPFVLMDYVVTKTQGVTNSISVKLLYTMLLLGLLVAFLRGDHLIKAMCLYSLLYMVFHLFFPFSPDRYLYPVVWIFYASPLLGLQIFLFKHKARRSMRIYASLLLAGLATCITITGNFLKALEYYRSEDLIFTAHPKHYRHEIRLSSQWLNTNVFPKPVVVVTYEPWVMDYFTTNGKVSFLYLPYDAYKTCNNVECLIASNNINPSQNTVLFVKQSHSLVVDESFPSYFNFNIRIFNRFPDAMEKNTFSFLTRLAYRDTWADVYMYKPSKISSIN